MANKIFLILILAATCLAVSPAIKNFNSGQVTPKLEARIDFAKYPFCSRKIENMFVRTLGPVQKRSGTKYITDTNGVKVRLVSFEYSTDDCYVIEISNGFMRFFRSE